jgi:hypothetical protein
VHNVFISNYLYLFGFSSGLHREIKLMKHTTKTFFIILFTLIFLLQDQSILLSVFAEPTAITIHIAKNGNDSESCGSTSTPCQTLQYAVDKAQSGDMIKVAKGTYTYNGSNQSSTCKTSTITPSVVCIIDKHLIMLGGYSTSDWSVSNPSVNPTIIDGQNVNRGLSLLGTSVNTTKANLQMEGFTIQNGLAQGANSGQDYEIGGYGGGMFTNAATFTMHNMIFKNNRAIGGNTSNSYGGHSAGGGLAVNGIPTDSIGYLENVTFEGNQALGGWGNDRGGATFGGGMFTYGAFIEANGIFATNNLAQAGSSNGNGYDNVYGEKADALGGGICIHSESNATLQNVTAIGNRAIGGIANGGQAGAGHGGGIYTELSNLFSLSDSHIENNIVIGGYGKQGGIGGGGGIASADAWTVIERSKFVGNTAKGGEGTQLQGSAGGGGGYLIRFKTSTTISIINTVFANNYIERGSGPGDAGGGGGGLWLQGVLLDMLHTTIDDNSMDGGLVFGSGMLLYHTPGTPGDPLYPYPNTTVNFSYGTVTNHQDTSYNQWIKQTAVHVWNGSTINFQRGLFAKNDNNLNDDEESLEDPDSFGGPGIINNMESMLQKSSAGYISPGEPNYNYHLKHNAEAKDQASSSNVTLDFDKEQRPFGLQPDIGADEYWPFRLSAVPGQSSLYLIWVGAETILKGALSNYKIYVSCESGAKSPQEAACNSYTSVGQSTNLRLTELTESKTYTITIYAYDGNQDLLATSETVSSYIYSNFSYLPLTVR